MEPKAILSIKNLCLQFPDSQAPTLNQLNLEIKKGECVVLIGANGSGKSSLLKIISGQYSSYITGELSLKQQSYASLTAKKRAQSLVSLNQRTHESLFYDLSVWENCLLYDSRFASFLPLFAPGEKKQEYAQYLNGFHPQLGQSMDVPVRLLSGGEMQCLAMALCLKFPCELLLLDEHTSAMSHRTSQELMDKLFAVLATRETSVVMITHNLSYALAYGDRLLVLQEGKIAHDLSKEEKSKLSVHDLLNF
jgi:putative ABC transport system ATP-binding protein